MTRQVRAQPIAADAMEQLALMVASQTETASCTIRVFARNRQASAR